jgi:hypothetical protein
MTFWRPCVGICGVILLFPHLPMTLMSFYCLVLPFTCLLMLLVTEKIVQSRAQNRPYEFPGSRLASYRFSPFGLSAFRVAASGYSGSPVALRPVQSFPLLPGRS